MTQNGNIHNFKSGIYRNDMKEKRPLYSTPGRTDGSHKIPQSKSVYTLDKIRKNSLLGQMYTYDCNNTYVFFKYIFECKVIQYRIVFIIRLARFCPTVFPLEEQLGLNLTKRTPGMLSCLGPRCDLHSFFFYLVHQDFYDPRLTDES